MEPVTTAAAPSSPPFLVSERVAVAGQRTVALIFWFALPIFCLFVLGAGADKLARHINNVPAGIGGTYTVVAHSCSEQICVTRGTFVSDDHAIVAPDQLGPYSWTADQVHRVVYDATSADIIPLPAHWDATATVTGMSGAVIAIGLWSWCLFHSVRRRASDDPVAVPVN